MHIDVFLTKKLKILYNLSAILKKNHQNRRKNN